MNYNDYGENPYYGGGGGGGGFMPGGSPGGLGSQGSPSGGRKRTADTLRPVTLKQLNAAEQAHPDAEFFIEGVELGQVTFVATIRNISRQATNVSYSMEDGTGHIDVRQWLESADDDSGKTEGIEQNTFVRVIGTLKSFNNKRSVGATVIRPVIDFNEVAYHKAEALYVTLYYRKGPLPSTTTANGTGGVKAETSTANAASSYRPATGSGARSNKWADLAPMHQKIMAAVEGNQDRSPDGVHVETIARECAGYGQEALMEGLEWLIGEGHLYTTNDDMHVLAT